MDVVFFLFFFLNRWANRKLIVNPDNFPFSQIWRGETHMKVDVVIPILCAKGN